MEMIHVATTNDASTSRCIFILELNWCLVVPKGVLSLPRYFRGGVNGEWFYGVMLLIF